MSNFESALQNSHMLSILGPSLPNPWVWQRAVSAGTITRTRSIDNASTRAIEMSRVSLRKKRIIRLSNFLFDGILSRMRPAFAPVYYLGRMMSGLKIGFMLLSNEYLKSRLGRCGIGVRFNGRIRVTAPESLMIGDNVHIHDNAFIRSEGGVEIDDNCHISRNLVVYSINHCYEGNALPYDEQQIAKPVHIGRNVWIGMNVMVIPGVTIGEGAIIGMGTTVRKDVESCAIVVGPCGDIVRNRNREHYDRLCSENRYSGAAGFH